MADKSKEIRTVCPKCGSIRLIPIINGKPSFEAYIEGKGKKQVFGDCAVDDLKPNFLCKKCLQTFYICE